MRERERDGKKAFFSAQWSGQSGCGSGRGEKSSTQSKVWPTWSSNNFFSGGESPVQCVVKR